MRKHVLVIGAATIDTKGRAIQPIRPDSSVPGLIRVSTGGVARNIAENLARLGEPVVLLTAVGDDDSGRRTLQQVASSGVDVTHALVAQDRHTAAYMAVLGDDGEQLMSLDDMEICHALLTPSYMNRRRALFQDAHMIVMDLNPPPATLQTIFRLARSYGVPVSADPTTMLLAPHLRPHLSALTLVTPNAGEAEALSGVRVTDRESGLRAAHRLVSLGTRIATVTLGATGLVYATSRESGHVPAIECEIVDATGAGDALTAAVVFGLLNQLPVDEAVRLGVSAAALTLQCRDTVCPTLSLERLYDQLMI